MTIDHLDLKSGKFLIPTEIIMKADAQVEKLYWLNLHHCRSRLLESWTIVQFVFIK